LCLGPLLIASHCYAQDVQYYWVKPDKVLLWKSADDTEPVTATFEPAPRTWTITPAIQTGPWEKILEEIAARHYPDLKLDAYKKENKLSALMLTKLHNNNVPWATLREPYAQIFWQPIGDNVQLSFLSSAVPPENPISFTRGHNGWEKQGNIGFKKLLNIGEETPASLRAIFSLPSDSTSKLVSDWDKAWDDFANAIFKGDQGQAITYEDKDKKKQWILWEKKSEALPKRYVEPLKLSLFKEPDPPRDEEKPPPEMTWPDIIRLIALSILGTVLLAGIVTAFIKRRALWKFVSDSIGNNTQVSEKAPTDNVIISPDGLDFLHQHALQLVQEPAQQKPIKSKVTTLGSQSYDLDQAGRNHLVQVLSWTHGQYLKIIKTDEFREKVRDLKNQVLAAHYQEIGIEVSEAENIPEWITLGRAFKATVLPTLSGSAFVKSTAKQQHPAGLKSSKDWMQYLPTLVNGLENQQGQLNEAKQRLENTANEQKSEKDKIQKKLEKDVRTAETRLAELQSAYDLLSKELANSQQRNKNLQAELDQANEQIRKTIEEKQETETSLTKFNHTRSEIHDVKQLSRDLRQWIQGYFVKQQRSDGDMRSVGLMAALVNYSLYQMCFSILEEHQPMRKAMAQNLLTFAQIFSQNPNYSTVLASLKRIEPKVGSAFDEATNPAGRTIDDSLFQACLRSLQTDTGLNLGPFFIDETENKINLVNAN